MLNYTENNNTFNLGLIEDHSIIQNDDSSKIYKINTYFIFLFIYIVNYFSINNYLGYMHSPEVEKYIYFIFAISIF